MEFSDTVKIEDDQKVIIDLDDGDSPEDIVVEWHLEMRRFFDENAAVVGESNLVNIMKEYIKSISARAIHFEDIDTLKAMMEKHIEHIYWLYKDMDLCFSDTYLDNMEHILTFYLNLTLRLLLALKRKVKVTQSVVSKVTETVIKRMSTYLLRSEYHIFHVLIRQTINFSDNLVKDILNILQSNICKQLFKNLFMHYLLSTPITDKSDESFCRVYIIFENWKAFEGNRQDEQIEKLMRNLMGRGSESIENNKFLSLILKPQASVIGELMKTVGCDPGITKSYFDYIKSRQKQELEILNDIEKLALEDRGWQEDDEDDDDEYSELFDKMMGDASKDFIGDNQNNTDVKDEQKFKSPPVDDEVIYCGSDSDSDVEIVSIKPSSSRGKAVNVPQKIYIQTLKNTGTTKPPKQSFLDSISIDTAPNNYKKSSRRDSVTTDKNLMPNPLSDVFRSREVEATNITKSSEVDGKLSQSNHNDNTCGISNNENESGGSLSHSGATEKIEVCNIIQTPCSTSITMSSSQDLQNSLNITVESTTGKSCTYVTDKSATDKSSEVIAESDAFEKIGTDINDLNITSNSIELPHCTPLPSPQICRYGTNSKESCNESSNEKAQIEKSDPPISNTLQEEELIKNDKLTEASQDIQISTTDIHDCHCSNIRERTSSFSKSEKESVSSKSQIENLVNPTSLPVERILKDPNHSVNKDISINADDVNSNVSSSSQKATSFSHKENTSVIEKSISSIHPCPSKEHSTYSNHQTSYGSKMIEVLDEVTLPEVDCSLERSVSLNNSSVVSQGVHMVSINNDVDTGKFVENEVGNQSYMRLDNNNVQFDNRVENQLYKQINLHSDEQLDIQICHPEKQINYPVKEISVTKVNNVIEHAQTSQIVESLKNETLCDDSNKSEKLIRCNGSQMINEVFKRDVTLRKGERRVLKRRHSDSNMYECSGSNRWGADLVRDKSEFKVLHIDGRSQESVHPAKLCVNDQSSMFLDTGQCVAPQSLDTGQAQVIAELSLSMTDSGEEHVADSVNPSDPKIAQHICSEKRTKCQSGKDELCGYPTPPGSEEDIDDTQPDPVYSNIFPTPACSTKSDCYHNNRAVFRLNSETESDATVDDSATTVQSVSQIRRKEADSRKDLPAETVVPDIVYNEQSMSDNEFLTEEIDPRDPKVSLEEEELLERLSDEEKNGDSESGSRNLAKSFAQIARDAVCDHEPEDSPILTRNVHESGLNRKATQITPSTSKEQLSSANVDDFAEMAQFLENCDMQYDSYNSSTPTSKKRKRQIKDVRFQDSPKVREKSQIKRRKMRKVETRMKSFDEFEAEVWNRQSPIGKFAHQSDSSDEDETTSQHSNLSNSRTMKFGTPTAAEKPSPSPPAKQVQANGSPVKLQPLSCSLSTPKHPPLKGILKKVEQSHSYHPLHPVDDDHASSFVYIYVEPDPDIGRGKMGTEGSRIKVSRKSLNAYKLFRDCKKLFVRFPRVSLEHVWGKVDIQWENISDPSKRLLWDVMPQRLYRIDYDKSTKNKKFKYHVYMIEQPPRDEQSSAGNTRNPNLEIGQGPGTVNLSNEIVCIESTDYDDSLHPVRLHDPPISPCLSPTSNTSSEFSDPTNLIPYQDIERALQVVEPDDQTCFNSPDEQTDSLRRDSGGDMLDNMSVEAIKLLSNNADFHKIFCDFAGEILIENVPVLDTEETESILNIDGRLVKPPPKVDVRMSDKLTDDLILNLNSDEELLKKICQELETNSLVDYTEFLHVYKDAYRGANRLSHLAHDRLPTVESVDVNEANRTNAFSQNSVISSAKLGHTSPSSFLPDPSQAREVESCFAIDYHSGSHTNIHQSNSDFETIDDTVGPAANIQISLPSNSYINTEVPHCALANNHYYNAQINTQSFQNSQIYQTPQVSGQVFHSSRVDQSLICPSLNDHSLHDLQKPCLVNIPMTNESLIEMSHKKSLEETDFLTPQNAIDISAANLGVTTISNASFYNSLNPLHGITGAVEPLQMDIVPSQSVQSLSDGVSPSTDINIRNVLFSPDNKPKMAKRGRPPKKSKKTREKSQALSNRVKRSANSNNYQERVPPIYHQGLVPVQTYTAPSHGKLLQETAETAMVKKKVKEGNTADFESTSSATNVHGKQKLLPMPVPQTYNFETDTLKQEVYNIRLEPGKVDNIENDAEFKTHLPLKKRKLSMPVPTTASSNPASKPSTSTLASLENAETNEISYPATPMLSIADFYIPTTSRPFKTPAEKKQLPVDPSTVPIRYDLPNDTTPFTCTMNTFTSNVYRLNECPYNVKLDCTSYCPPLSVMFPPESFGRSN